MLEVSQATTLVDNTINPNWWAGNETDFVGKTLHTPPARERRTALINHKQPMPPVGGHPEGYDVHIYCSYPHSKFVEISPIAGNQDDACLNYCTGLGTCSRRDCDTPVYPYSNFPKNGVLDDKQD